MEQGPRDPCNIMSEYYEDIIFYDGRNHHAVNRSIQQQTQYIFRTYHEENEGCWSRRQGVEISTINEARERLESGGGGVSCCVHGVMDVCCPRREKHRLGRLFTASSR